ncbi:hypothetical protein JW897_06300 [Chromobacterium alkanivorans]|uniref:hypothetical protein n=1 Tax=Chromobacterium alkanivorans TaxID=1071719 RepID=UPI0019684531|nr:hypothetical protein [Chromobacterium alkanivorans]MBN3003346.1 hypothetical protein [Chromobacterium alkanivorans]
MTVLIVLAVLLQLLDVATTVYALKRLGARELNGHLARLMARVGVLPALLLTKLALLLGCVLLRPPWPAYALLCAMYIAIVGNNLYQINKGRQNRP